MAYKADVLEAMQAQEQNCDSLLVHPDVAGVATGFRHRKGKFTRQVCVQVFVPQKRDKTHLPADAVLPPEVAGPDGTMVPTDVIECGVMQPLTDPTRYRPVVGGSSMGTVNRVSAGTLGGFVCDELNDDAVWLTNNHVVTDPGARTVIPADNRVVQQSRLDGGAAPADVIGRTRRITPIPTAPAGPAPVSALDAAIGSIDEPYRVEVVDIGAAPYELGAPALNMLVQKRGRTTEHTTNGRVVSLNAQWTLNYGTMWSPTFATIGTGGSVFNIATTDGNPFGDRGDSGSLVSNRTRAS